MNDDLGDETQAIPAVPEPEPTAPTPVTESGWVLADRYRVLDRIGAGGMADVFRAHDEQLDRDVAVKVFRTPVDEPGNASAVERREIELRALAQLSHPNLIALYDANVAGARPAFLVTELVIGPNLATRLNDGPLPEDLVRTIGAQIADALAYVHALGMVHRDVKPANILLGTDGPTPETATIRARLSDFGIVRLVDSARMTAAEFTLGTAFYLAPEQARGADVDAAADVYSLGLVLIEMLSGQRSFDGPMHEAMAARLSRAPEIPLGLPEPWPGLLAAMTRPDPATRPTAAQVAEALRSAMPPVFTAVEQPTMAAAAAAAAFAATPFAEPVPEPEPEPEFEPHRRRGLVMAIAALAFIAIIVTAAILILRPSSPSSTPTGGGTAAPTTGASAPTSAGTSKRRHPVAPATGGSSAPKSASSSSRSQASTAPASTAGHPTRTKTSSSPRHSPPPTKRTSTAPTSAPPTTPTSSAPPPSTVSSPAAADPPASGGASGAPASGVALGSPTS